MSIEESLEEKAIQAVVDVGGIIRKKERQRVCMEIIKMAVRVGGFKIEELPK